MVARFLGVLRSEIADVVSLQPYLTSSDVCRLALKVEKQQRKGKGKPSFSRFTPTAKPIPTTVVKEVVAPKPNMQSNTSASANNFRAPILCYKCLDFGHYLRGCPNQKTVSFIEEETYPVYDSDGEGNKQDDNEEVLYPDQG